MGREVNRVRSKEYKINRCVIYIFLVGLTVLTIYPIIYIFFGSFKENRELVLGGWNILPQKFVISNYTDAWEMANFAGYTFNSVILSIGTMIVALFVTSMAGYCYARGEFPCKELFYNLMIAFMFINVGSISLRPLFELAVKVHLNQSRVTMILISAAGSQATFIFLVRGYMNTIPKELDEAAKIDGCGFFHIYWKIILPILKPVLSAVALLSFRGGWNEYIMPMIFTMSNPSLRPLTVGVVSLRNMGDGAAAWNIMFAGSVISIVPIIILYMFTSKYFMEGMTVGAVKG
ncbi:MAG: carbohydrate ABC transporter permease [Hungatella sp.]|mgnify:CR=1 FL=1|nr:carbohydrate ABC transporter permease [Hungatella sp.]